MKIACIIWLHNKILWHKAKSFWIFLRFVFLASLFLYYYLHQEGAAWAWRGSYNCFCAYMRAWLNLCVITGLTTCLQLISKTTELLLEKKNFTKLYSEGIKLDTNVHLDSKMIHFTFDGQSSRSLWLHVRHVLMKAISLGCFEGISFKLGTNDL